MSATDTAFAGGFAEPVFGAQQAFRALMEALARPGRVQSLEAQVRPPAPMSRAAGAVALTLCDQDTPVWLDSALTAEPDVAAWIGFHTGAPLAADPGHALFAFVAAGSPLPSFDGFAQGTQEYPDRSTTLVVAVESLAGGRPLVLAGPGIRDEEAIAPVGLPDDFAARWAANGALFPRGIDMILAAPEGVVGLPRTVRIRHGEG